MNSNLNRALSAALVAFGGVAPALAQYDYPGVCLDPTTTNPYSIDFNAYYLETPLFGAGIGVALFALPRRPRDPRLSERF